MKTLIMTTLLAGALLLQTTMARTIEIEVHGMTCAFCVDSLEKKFKNMDAVSSVEISLKSNKIRLKTDENQPSIDTIRQTILDTGFTPVHIEILSDEDEQN
ncbi:heavy-metal-associated domain-containing protein [Methylophaga sp. OBS4]|uniref:heavy-metal-associated domain-containing protein n=1 Tax=Methylophaga sp. OBS4 TaxID=2991935 RepID=UPI002252878B|nr:heavy metal-associated domain-containing protein [Methylophaga sp. OBS4]MCX4186288.1 heavy-metal-associated domain-containing protein [Methylophaga sp. OBS4]